MDTLQPETNRPSTPPRGPGTTLLGRLLVIGLVLASLLVAAPSPVDAAGPERGPYFRKVRNTGIRCDNVGEFVYRGIVNLRGNEQMRWNAAIHSDLEWSEPNITHGSGTVRNYVRVHTYGQVDRYWFCNGRYQEMDYLRQPITRCMIIWGVYFYHQLIQGGKQWNWDKAPRLGHVSRDVC